MKATKGRKELWVKMDGGVDPGKESEGEVRWRREEQQTHIRMVDLVDVGLNTGPEHSLICPLGVALGVRATGVLIHQCVWSIVVWLPGGCWTVLSFPCGQCSKDTEAVFRGQRSG